MKNAAKSKITLGVLAVTAMLLAACSTDQVLDNSVGVAAGTTKVVAKGAVGAGKLAYKGGKAIVAGSD